MHVFSFLVSLPLKPNLKDNPNPSLRDDASIPTHFLFSIACDRKKCTFLGLSKYKVYVTTSMYIFFHEYYLLTVNRRYLY